MADSAFLTELKNDLSEFSHFMQENWLKKEYKMAMTLTAAFFFFFFFFGPCNGMWKAYIHDK